MLIVEPGSSSGSSARSDPAEDGTVSVSDRSLLTTSEAVSVLEFNSAGEEVLVSGMTRADGSSWFERWSSAKVSVGLSP